MARPIRATPKLNKKETVHFVNRLWNDQDRKEIVDLDNSVRDAREKRHATQRSEEK